MKKMFRFALILLFTLSGSLAQQENIYNVCKIDECYKTKKELNQVFGGENGGPPSMQKIVEECPSLFEVSDCIENKLHVCTGKSLSDLKSFEIHVNNETDKSMSIVATAMLNLRKVARDLCDENSDLHKNFKGSVECATKVFKEDNSKCWNAGKSDWASYLAGKRSANHIDPQDFMYGHQETICIEMSLMATCLAVQLDKECGKTAKNVFTDIAFDGLEIFKSIICKTVEHSVLIPEFLSSLKDVEIKDTLQIALHGYSASSGRTHEIANVSFYIAVFLFSWLLLW